MATQPEGKPKKPKEDKKSPPEAKQHPAYAFIQEARNKNTAPAQHGSASELAQRYRGSLYSAVSSGRDIKQDYTLKDNLQIWWAETLENTASFPGGAKFKDGGCRAKDEVECRILKNKIRDYRTEFTARLRQASEMAAYCRTKLGDYGQQACESKTNAIADKSASVELEDLIRQLTEKRELDAEAAEKAATHDERISAGTALCQHTRELDEAETALGDYTISAKENTRKAKTNTILQTSMDDRYQRVAEMCAILRQKGTHLDSILKEWEYGASSSHLILLKQKIEECDFALRRVNELNREYAMLEQQEARIATLPDTELDTAYQKACATRTQRHNQRQQDSRDSGDAAMQVVLQ